MTHREKIERFRAMHTREAGVLVLPNAWDAMSARVVEDAGAAAVATTSCGVAWSLGRRDGERMTRAEAIGAVKRIVDVVKVPVTADVEGGYGDVAATVRGIVDAGACGINLEDSAGDGPVLYGVEEQCARIAAARHAADAAGAPIYVNARIDVYLKAVGAPETRFDETVARAKAFVAAGADGVFVPGVVDAPTIRALADAVDAPLNVIAAHGAPDVEALGALGVARVSLGPYILLAAMAQMRRMAEVVLATGTYDAIAERMTFAQADGLMPETRGA